MKSTGKISLKLASPCQPKEGTFKISISDLIDSPCTTYKDANFRNALKSLSNTTATFLFEGSSDHQKCEAEIDAGFDFEHCKKTYEEEHCLNTKTIPLPAENTK